MYISQVEFGSGAWSESGFSSLLYLSFEWNFGFILFVLYFLQVFSGIILSFFMQIGIDSCLFSKAFVMKEIRFGWGASYLHMLLPNFLFFFLYLHMFKGFLFSIFSYGVLWISGGMIWILFIFISFTGYGLVFGSLGLWAMVVAMGILEFLFGEKISFLVFSEFGSLSDLLALKVFSYHFFFSLLVGLVILVHLYISHFEGSSLGVFGGFIDHFSFMSLFLMKDLFILLLVFFFLIFILCFNVEEFFSFDNFVELEIFKVPEEITSEWYLSFVFLLLRGMGDKSAGIFAVLVTFGFIIFSIFFKNQMGESLLGGGIGMSVFFFIFMFLTTETFNSFLGSLWMTTFFLFLVEGLVCDFFFLDFNFSFMSKSEEFSFRFKESCWKSGGAFC